MKSTLQTSARLEREGLPRDSRTESLWQLGSGHLQESNAEKFDNTRIYDVLIIGGGITGLTTALLLQTQGKNCILAEKNTLGYGTTGGTTSHINTYIDTTYDAIEKDFGTEGAKLVAEATKEAIALIDQMVIVHQIKCDYEYKPGYLFAETDQQAEALEKIFAASVNAGVSVHRCENLPIPIPYKTAITYESQAQFHPLKYIYGLAKAFVKGGGIILENTLIADHKAEKDHYRAEAGNLNIQASKIVYATHIPPGINLLHFRNAPYRSYALGVKIPENQQPEVLAYDMQNPYHYFRTQEIEGQKYLIVGGEDHKTGHGAAETSFQRLEEYTRKIYPNCSVEFAWSAQYYEPSDGLPYIGKLPGFNEGIFTATGFSGNGITWGSIAGKILSDLIVYGRSEYEDIFDPGRIKPVAGFADFVKENADVAYKFIADRLSIHQIDSLDNIRPDSGAIISYNDQNVAIYKDAVGTIHALNPVCTHARCIVQWNDSEKSWDCPCHGTRYDFEGNILTGPATRNLQKIEIYKE